MTPAVTPQPQTLAQTVRAKFPGAYDDLGDAALETKVLAKYPQYADMPRTQPSKPQADASISQKPGGATGYLNDLESDVQYGGTNTIFGRMLHSMGAQGTRVGSQAGAGDNLASPITGPIHAAQGVAQIPDHPFIGALKTLGGLLETGSIPASFMAPEAGEQAASIPGRIAAQIPSKARAAANFQEVMGAAKSNPVAVTDSLSQSLAKYQQLVDAGGSQSLSVRKLLNRVTDPSKGPLTYEEARMFSSNISRLSADEFNRLTPVMKQQVGAVRAALSEAIQNTATNAGKGSQYRNAMTEYAQRSKLNETASKAGAYLGKQALQKLPWLASVYAGKKIYDATK